MASAGVELGHFEVPLGLQHFYPPPRAHHALPLVAQFVAELGQQDFGQFFGFLKRRFVVAGPLVGLQLGLQPQHVGVHQKAAVGIVLPQLGVELVGVAPAATGKVGVRHQEDGRIGQGTGGVLEPDQLQGFQGVALGVEHRPPGVEAGHQRAMRTHLVQLQPVLGDGIQPPRDPIHVPRMLVFLEQLVVHIERLAVVVLEEVALGLHQQGVFFQGGVGPPERGRFVLFACLGISPLEEQPVPLGEKLHGPLAAGVFTAAGKTLPPVDHGGGQRVRFVELIGVGTRGRRGAGRTDPAPAEALGPGRLWPRKRHQQQKHSGKEKRRPEYTRGRFPSRGLRRASRAAGPGVAICRKRHGRTIHGDSWDAQGEERLHTTVRW